MYKYSSEIVENSIALDVGIIIWRFKSSVGIQNQKFNRLYSVINNYQQLTTSEGSKSG